MSTAYNVDYEALLTLTKNKYTSEHFKYTV